MKELKFRAWDREEKAKIMYAVFAKAIEQAGGLAL